MILLFNFVACGNLEGGNADDYGDAGIKDEINSTNIDNNDLHLNENTDENSEVTMLNVHNGLNRYEHSFCFERGLGY